MKKILILLTLVLASGLAGCSDFLDETPNKTGSAYIYHMDQLEGMMGNPNLLRTGYFWTDLLFLGDGFEYAPHYVVSTSTSGSEYTVWGWDKGFMETNGNASCTWTPAYSGIFAYNTVLENMNTVKQTTPAVRKQVEGEALYGRAYYHFMILVQYALWDENAPGIGYRVDTDPSSAVSRETVKYTLERIYQDLDNAEKALTEAGRTRFELTRNFRPTVPTVKALRARIDLYRGNYTDALANANAALAAYDYLHDFKNDPLYKIFDNYPVYVLNATDTEAEYVINAHRLIDLETNGAEHFWKHPEFYMPHFSDLYYANRNFSPMAEWHYNLFDRDNDERWKRFYDNNLVLYNRIAKNKQLPGQAAPVKCFLWEDQQKMKKANLNTYLHFAGSTGTSGKYYIIGLTTAEMHLIKAECLARAGQTSQAAEVLRTLRRTRFTTREAADNIGGSVQEVLDERAREMDAAWRFYDIKRLNGAENANIKITRTLLTNTTDVTSAQTLEIKPDDPRWAVAIPFQEMVLMGWQQN